MNLPDFAYKDVVELYNLYKDLAHGTDDQRRQLTAMIVQQITYDDPMGAWGHKAEKGGSVSKDTLGKIQANAPIAWDLFNGSTREPNAPPPLQSFDLNPATQEVKFYQGVDYLHHASGGGGTNPPPTDNSELQKQIDELKQHVAHLEERMTELEHDAMKSGDAISLQTGDTDNYLTAEGGGGVKGVQGKPGTLGPLSTDRTNPGGWETWVIKKR